MDIISRKGNNPLEWFPIYNYLLMYNWEKTQNEWPYGCQSFCKSAWVTSYYNCWLKLGIDDIYKPNIKSKLISMKIVNHNGNHLENHYTSPMLKPWSMWTYIMLMDSLDDIVSISVIGKGGNDFKQPKK